MTETTNPQRPGETDLSIQMRALADTGHVRADELRERAAAFDDATAAAGALGAGLEQTKRMLGAWARARRVWSECSGEEPI